MISMISVTYLTWYVLVVESSTIQRSKAVEAGPMCMRLYVCMYQTFIVSLACEVPDVNSHTTYNLYLYLNTHSRQTYRIPIDSSLEASAPATAAKRKGSLCYNPLRRVLPPRFRLLR